MEMRVLGTTSVKVSRLCLAALTDLIRAGKILYAGSSTFPPSQIVAAQWAARRRGRERFGQAGLSLIQLSLAFVTSHPAVSAAIIGPRTMDHLDSQLAAADVVLPPEVLDKIDEIVPPGTNLNPADRGYEPPALADAALRRR